MNYKIYIIFLTIILSIFSCNKKEEKKENKKSGYKLTQEDFKKIKKRTIRKQKEVVKLNVGKKKLILGLQKVKKAEEILKKKPKNDIKSKLKSLKMLKAQKELYDNRSYIGDKKNRIVNLHFYDELKHCLEVYISGYSLRNLKFKNNKEKIYLDSITFSYENSKKKILFEILKIDSSDEIIEKMKKKKDDFIYKKYNMSDIIIHTTVSYKYKVINILYKYLGYRWNVIVQNDVSEDFLEIIKSINYERFKKLKVKYDK